MIKWKKIVNKEDQPNYYQPVIIFAEGKVYYDWHRLSDGDNMYYGSLEVNMLIDAEKVTHWATLLDGPNDDDDKEIKNTEKDHDEMIEFIKGAFQCYVGGSDRRLLFDFLNQSKLKIVRK